MITTKLQNDRDDAPFNEPDAEALGKHMIDPTQYDTSGPGKFEAEPPETRYFYERMLKGEGEDLYDPALREDETPAVTFRITPEESDAFGLADDRIFMLREDSMGFIYGSSHPNITHAEVTFCPLARRAGHAGIKKRAIGVGEGDPGAI
jgi:hypothetical protein